MSDHSINASRSNSEFRHLFCQLIHSQTRIQQELQTTQDLLRDADEEDVYNYGLIKAKVKKLEEKYDDIRQENEAMAAMTPPKKIKTQTPPPTPPPPDKVVKKSLHDAKNSFLKVEGKLTQGLENVQKKIRVLTSKNRVMLLSIEGHIHKLHALRKQNSFVHELSCAVSDSGVTYPATDSQSLRSISDGQSSEQSFTTSDNDDCDDADRTLDDDVIVNLTSNNNIYFNSSLFKPENCSFELDPVPIENVQLSAAIMQPAQDIVATGCQAVSKNPQISTTHPSHIEQLRTDQGNASSGQKLEDFTQWIDGCSCSGGYGEGFSELEYIPTSATPLTSSTPILPPHPDTLQWYLSFSDDSDAAVEYLAGMLSSSSDDAPPTTTTTTAAATSPDDGTCKLKREHLNVMASEGESGHQQQCRNRRHQSYGTMQCRRNTTGSSTGPYTRRYTGAFTAGKGRPMPAPRYELEDEEEGGDKGVVEQCTKEEQQPPPFPYYMSGVTMVAIIGVLSVLGIVVYHKAGDGGGGG